MAAVASAPRTAIASTISAALRPGEPCWAPHSTTAFVAVTMDGNVGRGCVRVRSERDGASWECEAGDLLPRSLARNCVANMDELSELNMAEVLANVEELYCRRQPEKPGKGWSAIYSSVGPVLIAMNPFRELPLYGEQWVRAYRQAGNSIDWAWRTLGPHCYWTVEQAYQGLRAVPHQSVIICGESGAGKTVTNRKMLEYLLDAESLCAAADAPPTDVWRGSFGDAASALCAGAGLKRASGSSSSFKFETQKHQIVQANTLLEAFGNAQTLRNDNSSRFGKYSQLHFEGELYRVRGFEIEHYLLERSRIVAQPKGERNYHVFYQLLHSEEALKNGLVGGPFAYVFTRTGGDSDADSANEAFEELCASMSAAGFTRDEQRDTFRIISAVLHLGNVDFVGDHDRAAIAPGESANALSWACRLLGVEAGGPSGFETALLSVKTQAFVRVLGVDGARAQRDAVAKMLYSRVFDVLISRLNERFMWWRGTRRATIGLLDIFGFEDMPVNGLEQLHINLANERIQHIFNNIMFERELETYKREGVERVFDPGPSNLPCVELIAGKHPPGIMSLLADQCKAGSDGTDRDRVLVARMNRALKDHSHYTCVEPQTVRAALRVKRKKWDAKGVHVPELPYSECFQVRHYAGQVLYNAREFVAKSKDVLPQHLQGVLRGSARPEVAALFRLEAETERDSQRHRLQDVTVGENFVGQLNALSRKLDDGKNFFVRCIKPNARNIPCDVDRTLVLDQLNCGGVVAALEMRRIGFPDRMDYREFCDEFWILELGWRRREEKASDARKKCEELLRNFIGDDEQVACGHTKIFMRGGVLASMRAAVGLRIRRFVVVVQRKWRLKKGTQLIHTVEEAHRRLEEIKSEAGAQGVLDCEPVAMAVSRADTVMSQLWQSLKEAQERYATSTPRTAKPKIARELLAEHGSDIQRLRQLVVEVSEACEKVQARIAKAEMLLATRLQEGKQLAQVLLAKVAACEEERGDEVESSEVTSEGTAVVDENAVAHAQVACAEACRRARARLEEFLRRDLPNVQQEGLATLDLSRDDTAWEPAPRVAQIVAEITALVQEAEAHTTALSAARVAFAETVQRAQEQRAEAERRLEALKADAIWAAEEGLSNIEDAFQAAWELHDRSVEIMRGATDAALFQASVDELVVATRVVEDALVGAKKLRDEARAREKERSRAESTNTASTRAWSDRRESASSTDVISTGEAFLAALAEAQRQLEGDGCGEADRLQVELRITQDVVRARLASLGFSDTADSGDGHSERTTCRVSASRSAGPSAFGADPLAGGLRRAQCLRSACAVQ